MKIKISIKDKEKIPSWIHISKEEKRLSESEREMEFARCSDRGEDEEDWFEVNEELIIGKGKNKCSKKKKSIYTVLVIVTIIMFFLVAIAAIGGVVWLCLKSEGVPVQEVETTLLASGLAIIGMAISVWTGLNIINAIEKKDVEKIQQQLTKTEQNLKWILQETKGINIIKSEQKDIYRGLFLQELLKTNHDAMSRYFYNLFAKNKYLSITEYSHLLLIEQYFSQVYLQYSEKTANKSLIVSRIEDGTKKIDIMLEKSGKTIRPEIEKYLLFRKHEFSFLKGYLFDGIKMYEAFMNAAKGFENIGINFGLKKPYSEMHIDEMEDKGADLQVAVYFMNSMGEAYSKIVQDTSLKNKYSENNVKITETDLLRYADNAVKYLELAVKWNQRLEEREVYYRNLGCAYERMDKLKEQFGRHSEQIINNYRKAFQVAVLNGESNLKRIQNIYHTVLSYYEKYIKFMFGYEEREYAFGDVSKLKKLLEDMKKHKEKSVQKYLIDYRRMVEFGVTDTARNVLPHNMNGLSWTWIVVFRLSEDKVIGAVYQEDIGHYMKKIEDVLENRKIMGISENDKWYQELVKRYEVLCKYMGEKE